MKLEDEIKANKFASEAQKAHLNILFTASWFKRRMKGFFDGFGITMEQYNVLRIIRGAQAKGSIRVIDISDRMIERSSNTTRIIDKLEKKDLVERHTSRVDKRALSIHITKAGIDFMQKIDAAFEVENPHFSALDEEKCKQLNELLDTMRLADEL